MFLELFSSTVRNIVAGILVISFGILLGNLADLLSKRLLHSFEIERLLNKAGVSFPYEESISTGLRYLIYLVALILGLRFLGLDKFMLYLILFIILGILIAFILLSFRDFVPSFIAGVIIHFSKKVKKNESILFGKVEGKVLKVGLLDTTLESHDGDIVLIPNYVLIRSRIRKKK
jgi:small-conductance mechanosensitive channel